MASLDPALQYVPYSDSVEVKHPDEDKTFAEIAAAMRHISEIVNDRSRNAFRAVHAKSHALLKARMSVGADIPTSHQQGLFRPGAEYPIIMRFSTNPGDILPDSISSPRGLAVKVVGVTGAEMVPTHAGQVTQDFVLVNAKAFGAPDAAGFLKIVKLLEQHVTDSASLKQFVSTSTRLVENVLQTVGGGSDTLKAFGHPETHILGESFFSQAPIRYGDYIAKISIQPVSANLKKLKGRHVEQLRKRYSGLRDEAKKFFESETAEWDLCVQLCTDLQKMPVEDASVKWLEDVSPYLPVARITATPQDSYSAERRVYVDEKLSFNPWSCLADHRPLGNIMRSRFAAYQASSSFRHSTNGREMIEPKSIDELPD
ncbi:MAG: catalase family protein [Bryobacteraceae bacterium]